MSLKNRILFVGTFTEGELLNSLMQSKSLSADFATNNYQNSFMNTLEAAGFALDIISIPFARLKKFSVFSLFIINKKNRFGRLWEAVNLPNCTIPIVRTLWEIILLTAVIPFLRVQRYEKIIIFSPSPSLNLPFLFYCKVFGCDDKLICIVDDLPDFTRQFKISLIKSFKSIYSRFLFASSDLYFGFIFLSQGAISYSGVSKNKTLLIEGIYSEDSYTNEPLTKFTSPILPEEVEVGSYVLYSGGIELRQGVRHLIEGFIDVLNVEPDLHLILCGQGSAREPLLNEYSDFQNIHFLPSLEKRTLRCLMKQSLCLVNPANPSEEFTNYFFPSKLTEYLSIGVTTVGYRLPCIPKEYWPFFIEIADSKGGLSRCDEIASVIIKVCKMSIKIRCAFASRGSAFIKEKKGTQAWAAKLELWLNSEKNSLL